MNPLFEKNELPVIDLQKLGLYKDGKNSLSADDTSALFAGRRTDLISIQNLRTDAFHIQQLDAKLSLQRHPDGSVSLNLHPIYKNAVAHELLDEREVEQLKAGKIANVTKQVDEETVKKKTLIIEYDAQTREFISYDPSRVQVPEKVNGQQLTPEDKQNYQSGNVVQLKDGTRVQHRASERNGMLSDRQALILSVLLDGGISYLLITGIRNLLANREEQKSQYTKDYEQALKEMKDSTSVKEEIKMRPVPDNENKNDDSRGYGRCSSR
ncbi:DUF4099 domain-containing protein [Pedobacter gandavensis]|uniref:DUF4099 domain-containing protein n=1 Tax=Pedobacter gandavensis TaxID=2679963 RepID=UPI0024796BC9|nr:DUF4099 domain-containing protein [Pedobacter gandavensis]WGQ08995.1 DUF4099 domain-containing protein [Pedobacter gandavensis]